MILTSLLLVAVAVPADLPEKRLRIRLDRVADRCHLPRSAFKLDAEGRLHVRPPASAGYRKFDCAFTQLKREGVDTPMAVVGSEVVTPSVKP
jgi:hypothetical protein